jgi:hypothetical protein
MRSAIATTTRADKATAPTAPINPAKPDATLAALATDRYTVISVSDFARLDSLTEQWESLAAQAIEPNPFYEHGMLRAALKHLGAGVDLRVVLIFAPNPARPAQPLLSGVFPLERRSRHKDLPCRTLSLWRHKFCQFATPLIRASHARETMQAFFAWLASADHGCTLMEFNRVSGEGAFHHLFVDHLDHHAILHDTASCFAESENIRRLHDDARARWMDSFTSRDNAMFNRLWRDRVLLRDVTVGAGSRRGDLIVSLLPLLRRLKRRTKRAAPTAHP